MDGTYRKNAAQALLAAMAISALISGVNVFSILAGPRAFRRLAMTMAQLCQRVWADVPVVLQVILGMSVAIGLLSGCLWLWSAARQWRSTAGSVRSVLRKRVTPPPKVLALLQKHALAQRVSVFRSTHPFAFTGGLITPRILISTGLIETLEGDELEAVLLHEQSHLRNKDSLYLFLGRALTSALFYVPAVKALVRRHQAAIELAADEYVIATQGGSLSLSSAMVKLLRALPSAVAANFFTGVADLRLSYLLKRDVNLPDVSRWSMVQSAAAIVAIATPVAAIYGLAEVLKHVSFISRCMV